jgi:hypothetical protein
VAEARLATYGYYTEIVQLKLVKTMLPKWTFSSSLNHDIPNVYGPANPNAVLRIRTNM